MATLSGDAWMQGALQEGQGDFFNYHLLPVAYPDMFPNGVPDVDALEANDYALHKELRTNCKAVQYGLAFGRQAPAIAKALKMPVRAAQELIANYFDTAPDFAQWRLDVMEAAVTPAKRDLLVTVFGRRFHSELVTPRNSANVQREALSFLPQSTSSDICLSTAIAIDDQLYSWGFQIVNVVHDAIMAVGPEDKGDMVGEYIGEQFRAVGKLMLGDAVPFLSNYSMSRSWAGLD